MFPIDNVRFERSDCARVCINLNIRKIRRRRPLMEKSMVREEDIPYTKFTNRRYSSFPGIFVCEIIVSARKEMSQRMTHLRDPTDGSRRRLYLVEIGALMFKGPSIFRGGNDVLLQRRLSSPRGISIGNPKQTKSFLSITFPRRNGIVESLIRKWLLERIRRRSHFLPILLFRQGIITRKIRPK